MANLPHPRSPDEAEKAHPEWTAAGPRKLVRPRIADQATESRRPQRHEPPALMTHQKLAPAGRNHLGNHAEMFYFQKQMQAQTIMVFVLDDGERIEGVIEWYDLDVIKVRHATRTMIYKASIKYLFKASDVRPNGANGDGMHG